MNVRMLAVTVNAPRDEVFNFLATVENLPRWTAGYCEQVYLQRGGWWALTADGDLMVEFAVHPSVGLIDISAGASLREMFTLSLRVIDVTGGRSLVTLALIDSPRYSEPVREARFERLQLAMEGLLLRFEGGEVHESYGPREMVRLGRN